MNKKFKLKNKLLNIISNILIIVLICLFIYSLYYVISWAIDNNKTNSIIEGLNVNINDTDDDSILINSPDDENDIYYKYVNVSLIDVDINELKKENSDTVGWLQVEGTSINYPVVDGIDNEYYLYHDYLKNSNKLGWVFLDYRNVDLDNLDKNNIIYGHRTRNGTMFDTLKNVLTDEWLSDTDNHIVKVSSVNYNYLFQVFSVYKISTETYYIQTEFATTSQYQEFLDTISSRSIHDFNTSVNTNDTILTLSTCSDNNTRVVLHAKLIKMSNK